MKYRVDHELPTKEELKNYSKDTLDLMRQNVWLCLKLIVGGIIGASIVGFLIALPNLWGLYSLKEGITPDFLYFMYEGTTFFLRLVFSCVPIWLILYYTGFRLMESRQVIIPSAYIVKKQFSLLNHFWTVGFLAACFFVMMFLSGLLLSSPEDINTGKELSDGSISQIIAMITLQFTDRSMELGIGFYWFSFIHIMIFNALLFGKESTPNIHFTLTNLFWPKVTLNRRMILFFSFVVIDCIESLISYSLVALLPNDYGFIIAVFFRGLFYLFIAGILYCYCVDKIEGRKLKKKVTSESFSGKEMPIPT